MSTRWILAVMLAVTLAGCGVKNRLDQPMPGTEPQQNNRDPSQPPQPLGQ